MATSNIVTREIGIPGPQGAGVSAPEKASYAVKSGPNTFTDANEFRKSSTSALMVSSGSNTTDRSAVFDALNKEIELWNGADLRGFSDAGTTETYSIDGATGNIQTDGTIQVDGGKVKGEQLWLGFEIDGGGSAITTGSKRFPPIPWDCQIVVDPTFSEAWRIGLDQVGSISLDLWMDTFANWPPTNADRISGTVGSQNPRVSSAIKASSSSLTGWTVNLVKGSVLVINVNSAATATFCTLMLHVKKI